MIKVIFLDIDGVLLPFGGGDDDNNNNTKKNNDDDEKLFPRRCVESLHRILRATGAQLVLSSTWRMRDDFINDICRGADLPEGFYDTTSLSIHSLRQWEIADWILNYDKKNSRTKIFNGRTKASSSSSMENHRYGTEQQICWLALDDEDLLEDEKYRDMFVGHVIKTESSVGLTVKDAEEAISLWDDQLKAFSNTTSRKKR
jgi:HAD domain in Swiss Army Knife RNA repair proteins